MKIWLWQMKGGTMIPKNKYQGINKWMSTPGGNSDMRPTCWTANILMKSRACLKGAEDGKHLIPKMLTEPLMLPLTLYSSLRDQPPHVSKNPKMHYLANRHLLSEIQQKTFKLKMMWFVTKMKNVSTRKLNVKHQFVSSHPVGTGLKHCFLMILIELFQLLKHYRFFFCSKFFWLSLVKL